MADIFVSYRKTDAARVAPLAIALESSGWSVWWDTRIGAGEQWDEVIEREIAAARCVVVVWSHESVASRWVRTEANEGLERGILVPVLIDDVPQPLAFKLVQSVNLVGWTGGEAHGGWAAVIAAISNLTGKGARDEPKAAGPAPNAQPQSAPQPAPALGAIWAEIGSRGAGTLRQLAPKQSFIDFEGAPEMVVVPAGTFTMGSPTIEPDRRTNEGPQHEVVIAQPFAIGKYPVTVGQYDQFLKSTGHKSRAQREVWKTDNMHDDGGRWEMEDVYGPHSRRFNQGPNHPVVNVSWDDASAYAEWLQKKSGRLYRLLSESEWEYAARARTTTPFWWGNASSTANSVFNSKTTYGKGKPATPPTGTRDLSASKPNPFGLCDMLGNVSEWVADFTSLDYSAPPPGGQPNLNVDVTGWRIVRGGGWSSSAEDLRAARRSSGVPDRAWEAVGFRVARDLV